MRTLVTGGAGFIGSYVVDMLLEKGNDVIVIDNLSTGLKENLNKKIRYYTEDLKNHAKINEIFFNEKPEIVFHLAAQANVRKSVEDPVFDADINILSSLNLLELARKFNSNFIFSSSGGAIYGETEIPTSEGHSLNPASPYGCSKLAVEKYIDFYNKNYGFNFVCLRYSNVYGGRQNSKGEAGVVGVFFDKMLRGEIPVIFGNGKKTRDFVYVEDVARANILAMESNKAGVYNVGTGKETSILELFGKINSFFDNKFRPVFENDRPGEQMRSCLNIGKIRQVLCWEPEFSLDNGLRRSYEWFKNKVSKQSFL